MNELLIALAPAFAAGFAVQQFLEITDPLVTRLSGNEANTKKLINGLSSFVIGILLAILPSVRILEHLAQLPDGKNSLFTSIVDVFITGLVISAGTEGINSILKFLGYKKEEKKAEAANKKSNVANVLKLVNRQ